MAKLARVEREKKCTSKMGERGLPHKHQSMHGNGGRGPKKLEEAWGKVYLESHERWKSVCGGGDGERAPSSPLKLEEELC